MGAVPPVLFLLWSQWEMFGNPFLPAQYWMPNVNYTDRGWRGFSWPSADLFVFNLFHPSYGMFTYGPLLLVGFLPARRYSRETRLVEREEAWFISAFVLLFLGFCAANQYSRMQWNTGFRYLVVLVPFVYLLACEHLGRLSPRSLLLLSVPVILHSWVLSMVREPVPEAWRRFLTEGFQLPWLTVLRRTSPPDNPWLNSQFLPIVVFAVVGALVASCWYTGKRWSKPDTPVPGRPSVPTHE
jgi:hypothetical protein